MSDATRERILEATETLLRRHGADKVAVVDVARALGMSHANVYRFFDSKEALRNAIVERWLLRVTAPLDAIVAADGPAGERLREWCLVLMAEKRRKVLDDPDMFAAFQGLVSHARAALTGHMGHLTSQVHALISAGCQSGEFRVADKDAATHMVLDATVRFHHPRLVAEAAGLDLDRRADAVIRMVLAGLAGGVL
ncbi:MAG TPA: TetR/AcrR family transcriptional regulator [Aliidongia sp.]|uniref:TetR/AcrR family transcriptional regulator n=1 Tax=Aliidongia sp. TaxID=1914230 RepID=UPI002DDC9E61|nr:TetR/AcrR family transcriptional regulator [Aliidongia sp.]HEV2675083.1 TetR/AcrR family transcriptional regulator [Aliidongia sp.]